MVGLFVNHDISDDERRNRLFAGDLFLRSRSPASEALCDHAIQFITSAFGPHDPQRAQFDLPVADFISRVGPLKSQFTNDLETKRRIRHLLAEMNCDLEDCYFDVPRLRVVPHGDYLSAGVSYAYRPHRDIWYSSPTCQVNIWMPVFPIVPERAMSFFPAYFAERVANSSSTFDYDEWCAVGRQNAVTQVTKDTRKHPLPLQPIADTSELRIAGTKGDAILFSAAHLHATAPNQSGLTRFSIDFRTICMTDLRSGRGAQNIDSGATGTTLADFIRASDFCPIDLQQTERARAARSA